MAGYRDTTNYDPFANPRYGRPLRPFDWVQWTGVVFDVIGIALYVVYFAGQVGWIAHKLNSPMYGFPFIMLAIPLINSRREQVPDLAPELAQQRRRMLLVTILVCAVVIGAAVLIHIVTGA